MRKMIKKEIPDTIVVNCEIGNGKWDSMFMDISHQIKLLVQCINQHKITTHGYIGVGHSQGAYLMRALLEEFNHEMAPMVRFISLSGPQGGFFCGVQSKCWGKQLPRLVQKLIFLLEYSRIIQANIAPSQYWRNPYKLKAFTKNARSLPFIDNQ
uniref:Palmitoyl-protein thioesterase n=1 Tax=Spironucleus salmonicida TaxID=348837 RepID=V6LD97_9EUKA|eukprot:EST42452.1 Palmitoyl-protein thioesterase [Spironucleus salmonicida]